MAKLISLLLISLIQANNNMKQVGKQFIIMPTTGTTAQSAYNYRWYFIPNCTPQEEKQNLDKCAPILLARRSGLFAPFIAAENTQFEDRVEMDQRTNHLIIQDTQLSDTGGYRLDIEPPNARQFSWGPQNIVTYKRPDDLTAEFSSSYKKLHAAVVIPDSANNLSDNQQIIASCKATGAHPPMKLHWKSADSSIVEFGELEPTRNSDGTYTTEAILKMEVLPKYNKMVFTCVAEQPEIPDEENIPLTKNLMLNVFYPPENTVLEMAPLDNNTDFNSFNNDPTNSNTDFSNRKVRCRSNANPQPRFNITMPNGSMLPIGKKSKQNNEFVVPFADNGLEYSCTATNNYGSESTSKTVSELLNLDSGTGTIIAGLPMWLWVIIIVALILGCAALILFCYSRKDNAPKKKRGKKGAITKLDISRPNATNDLLENVRSRQGLSDIRRVSNDSNHHDNDSLDKPPIITSTINTMSNIQNTGMSYAPNESLQQHMHLLQQQNNVLKDIDNNRQYLDKAKEIYQDEEMPVEMDVDHNNLQTEDVGLLAAANTNNNTHGYNTNSLNRNEDQFNSNDLGNNPNFMRNNPMTGSNRPYSEIYGYGSSVNTHTGLGVGKKCEHFEF